MELGLGGCLDGCLGDAIGEAVLGLLACGILAALVYGFVHAPLLTAGVLAPVGVFAGYGGWLMLRRSRRGARIGGRVAVAAAVTVVVVVVVASYAVTCSCLD
jgi:hypothetical protein